jgi:hypothetical protein
MWAPMAFTTGGRVMLDDVWTVTRSLLNPRVWLPYDHEGDQSCFLYAGSLTAVKAWVETRVDLRGKYRWVHDHDDWILVDSEKYPA